MAPLLAAIPYRRIDPVLFRLRPLAAIFLVLYGVARFGVESTRRPDAQLGFLAFGWLASGHLLSAATVAAGVLILAVRSGRPSQAASSGPAMSTATPDGASPRAANRRAVGVHQTRPLLL